MQFKIASTVENAPQKYSNDSVVALSIPKFAYWHLYHIYIRMRYEQCGPIEWNTGNYTL